VLLETVDDGDVGVAERRQQLRLALEAGEPVGVAGEVRRQYFESGMANAGSRRLLPAWAVLGVPMADRRRSVSVISGSPLDREPAAGVPWPALEVVGFAG
jgi:hypothetical protein